MNEEYYCTHCGAVLNKQKGFDPSLGRWFCKECGQLLINEDPQGSEMYPEVTWFCDGCGAVLNEQKGFSDNCEEWACKECGYVNVISDDEIYDTSLEVSHIEMTGDVEKDSLIFWKLLDKRVHVVTKIGNSIFGIACDFFSADENENGIPGLGIIEDINDKFEFEISSDEIAWIDVIEDNQPAGSIPS